MAYIIPRTRLELMESRVVDLSSQWKTSAQPNGVLERIYTCIESSNIIPLCLQMPRLQSKEVTYIYNAL
jgi:hypothetical protein